MLTTSAVVLAVSVLTSFLRKVIFPKWGRTGVQFIVFCLALIGALYITYQGQFPVMTIWANEVLKIFAASVTLYEVLLKQIPLFRKGTV